MNPRAATKSSQASPHHPTARRKRSPLRSYLSGAALIFDFTGSRTWHCISTIHYPDDAAALAADWQAVGDDLRNAMDSPPANPHRDRN